MDVWNKQSQENEVMYFARYCFRNVLDYCDYLKLCNGITKFPKLSTFMLNYGITLPLYASKILIIWRYRHIPCLEIYIYKIKINTCNDYTFTSYYFWDKSINK